MGLPAMTTDASTLKSQSLYIFTKYSMTLADTDGSFGTAMVSVPILIPKPTPNISFYDMAGTYIKRMYKSKESHMSYLQASTTFKLDKSNPCEADPCPFGTKCVASSDSFTFACRKDDHHELEMLEKFVFTTCNNTGQYGPSGFQCGHNTARKL